MTTVETSPGASAAALPASGSSFYTAMRILPPPQRDAMYAIYAFCRAVDDVADGTAPRPARAEALAGWRADVDRLFQGVAADRVAALVEPRRRFGLRREDFHAIIDGMAMDAQADIVAPDWTTLDLYCDCVASAVGRLSTRVFGLGEEDGRALAHHLGRALQLTNILRDLDEDAAIGRLYLPREALAEAGIQLSPTKSPVTSVLAHPAIGRACAALVERARTHFAQAQTIMDRAPRKTVRAPRLMAAAYGSVLARLVARGFAPPRERVSVSRLRLLGALVRHGLW